MISCYDCFVSFSIELQAFDPDFVSSVDWLIRMVIGGGVVLALLVLVAVVHQVCLQSLPLLLPVVVGQGVAPEPPDEDVMCWGCVQIYGVP